MHTHENNSGNIGKVETSNNVISEFLLLQLQHCAISNIAELQKSVASLVYLSVPDFTVEHTLDLDVTNGKLSNLFLEKSPTQKLYENGGHVSVINALNAETKAALEGLGVYGATAGGLKQIIGNEDVIKQVLGEIVEKPKLYEQLKAIKRLNEQHKASNNAGMYNKNWDCLAEGAAPTAVDHNKGSLLYLKSSVAASVQSYYVNTDTKSALGDTTLDILFGEVSVYSSKPTGRVNSIIRNSTLLAKYKALKKKSNPVHFVHVFKNTEHQPSDANCWQNARVHQKLSRWCTFSSKLPKDNHNRHVTRLQHKFNLKAYKFFAEE